MRATTSWGLIATAVLTIAGAHAARAQGTDAGKLEARATAALADGCRIATAASLYQQAALGRSTDDPRSIEDFRLAGLLYAGSGQPERAAAAMERAGEQALSTGRLDAAVDAFTNAALIQMGRAPDRAAMLAHRALWLAQGEGVSEGARAVARARLGTAVAAAVRKI